MSRQLALAAAASVLMMASYVLFGGQAAKAPPAGEGTSIIEAAAPDLSAPALPSLLVGR